MTEEDFRKNIDDLGNNFLEQTPSVFYAIDGNESNLDSPNIIKITQEELIKIKENLLLCAYQAFISGFIDFDSDKKEYRLLNESKKNEMSLTIPIFIRLY